MNQCFKGGIMQTVLDIILVEWMENKGFSIPFDLVQYLDSTAESSISFRARSNSTGRRMREKKKRKWKDYIQTKDQYNILAMKKKIGKQVRLRLSKTLLSCWWADLEATIVDLAGAVVAASIGECGDRLTVGSVLLDIDIRDVTVSWFCFKKENKKRVKNTLGIH